MIKKLFLSVIFCFVILPAFAKHIIGGEMFYTYIGQGTTPNTSEYRITLRLFRDDYAPADAATMPEDVFIGIFNNDNGKQFPGDGKYYTVKKTGGSQVRVNEFPTCMQQRPTLSYEAGEFSFIVTLPNNATGYTVAYQTCCRITPIDNIFGGRSGAGSIFACTIPPEPDSSPIFNATIDAVCGGKQFRLQFDARDVDGDSLSYSFEPAYDGGSATDASNINPEPPPYPTVPYTGSYSPQFPLGNQATIDPVKGIITGVAPPTGRYVVTVGVTSWRRKNDSWQKLSMHRKDFIINVSNCDFAAARLEPRGTFCDGFLTTFENADFSPHNKTFYWEFANEDSSFFTTSDDERPAIEFPAPGVYNYKLIVNKDDFCSDSAVASIGIYPGFKPQFAFDGQCINSEVIFTDQSTTAFGTINSWRWDFGDGAVRSDTSLDQHPQYTYGKAGNYNVSLTVQSSFGCLGTVTMPVKMIERPKFSVSNDTLICDIDRHELIASGSGKGKVFWTPNYRINDQTSFNPIVTPQVTTTYYANYEESRGCTNMDSVVVNVVSEVSLAMPADTTICLTDSVLLKPHTDGLHFSWGPDATVANPREKDAVVFPTANTTYSLTARIGLCSTTANTRITTVPYPRAQATADTSICIGNNIQLLATGGSIYEWQPNIFLDANKVAAPLASPTRSIQYIVKVNDVLGCPKPTFDTVLLKVITPFVDAGPRDTAIVVGEPLQLTAVGNGENFLWTPSSGLSSTTAPNPVARLTGDQEYVVRLITEGSCIATDTIMVHVYNLKPGFYIPNAFTPNGDGLNDEIRPIAFGLKSLRYFRIYNRLGQLVYSTTSFRDTGWDGSFKGTPQGSGVFAWTAEAVDYTGKRVIAKGSITLIR